MLTALMREISGPIRVSWVQAALYSRRSNLCEEIRGATSFLRGNLVLEDPFKNDSRKGWHLPNGS